jgi:hypothetical protein
MLKKILLATAVAALASALGGCGSAGMFPNRGMVESGPQAYVGGAPAVIEGYPQTQRRVGRPEAPIRLTTEHPPGTPNQFRCDATTGQPTGGPGTGNAWCD